MSQSAAADPISSLCIIGAGGRSNLFMFVVVRDLVVIGGSLLLLAARCLRSTTTPLEEGGDGGGFGVVCGILPIAQSFWTIATLQQQLAGDETHDASIGGMAIVVADPTMGALLGGALLARLCWRVANGQRAKHGDYEPPRSVYPPPHSLLPPPPPPQQQRALTMMTTTSSGGGAINSSALAHSFLPPSQPPPPPPPPPPLPLRVS